MDLRQLRYFVVLAGQRHFGRAANVLHIAQPALTRQIKLLEDELGVQLFERHARGATPTDDAARLLERASFILRYAEQTKLDMTARQLEPSGPVAVGLSPGLAIFLSAPLAIAMRERYPQVQLQIVEAFSDVVYEQLLGGTIDLGVLTGSTTIPKIVATPMMTERMCLIGLADDARLKSNLLKVAELDELPLILTGASYGGVRLELQSAAARVHASIRCVIEVQSVQVAKRLVAAGLGYTVHFAAPIKDAINAGVMKAVPIAGLVLNRFIARSADRPPSRATVALSDTLIDVVSSLVLSGEWPNATLAPNFKRHAQASLLRPADAD